MSREGRTGAWPRVLGWTLLAVGLVGPFAAYELLVARAPSLPAGEALHRLEGESRLVLVEIEPAGPLEGLPVSTLHVPWANLMAVRSSADLPETLRNRPLALLCQGGLRSARAAAHLRGVGVDAVAVQGGMQGWTLAHAPRRGAALADVDRPFFRVTPPVEQFAAAATFFAVKLAYTLLAIAVAVALWRSRENALVATRRGMLVFAAGECACAWNVLVLGDRNVVLEHAHSVAMVVSAALVAHALLDGLDARLVHFSDDGRCAALPTCGVCFRHAAVGCGLRQSFLAALPALVVVAALPLFAPLRPQAWNTRIFGAPFSYGHPVVHQVYELRVLPVIAIALLLACAAVLLFLERRPVPVAKLLLSAAVGAMSFSFLRLLLLAAFADDQVWFGAWEETTELLYVGLVASTLLAFERGLLQGGRATPATAAGA